MEFLPKLAGLAVGIGVAIGVLYNVGFFLALDLPFFTLLTYKDHLATLVLFAPIAVLPILLCIGLRADPVRRRRATIGAGALAAIAIAFWLERSELGGDPALMRAGVFVAGLAALLLVIYCAAVLLDRGLAINEKPADDAAGAEATRATSFAFLGLLMFVTMLGAAQATLAMGSTAFDTQLTLTSEGAPVSPPRPARVVRIIDKGLLVVFQDTPGRITFVRTEMVRLLSDPARP
jgi:hypothetical protein